MERKEVSISRYELDGLLSKIEELSGRLDPIRGVYEKYKHRKYELKFSELWKAIEAAMEGVDERDR